MSDIYHILWSPDQPEIARTVYEVLLKVSHIEEHWSACYDALVMSETLSASRAAQRKFLQLADFLEKASQIARELARSEKLILPVPDLIPPKIIPKEDAWFWSKEWQAEERQVNEEFQRGEYQAFDSVDALLADLHAHV